MRVAAWTAGIIWFLLCAAFSYARFARPQPEPATLTRGAVAPPPLSQQSPAATVENGEAGGGNTPAQLTPIDAVPGAADAGNPPVAAAGTIPPPEVMARPAGASEPFPATPPPSAGGDPAGPRAATGAGTQPAFQPEARCLVCGAPASSWVEVDGRRVGYCRQHYSQPAQAEPGGPDAAARAKAASGGFAAPTIIAATASVQCRGLTKNGERCRRKTKDPSGFCYQHRPQ